MCGICGAYLDRGRLSRRCLVRMRDIMTHRGPDGQGLFLEEDGSLGLGHRRLVVIDPDTGAQPMESADGRYLIVYNGEIYNYLELKTGPLCDYPFSTKSDTEVILAAYQKWGRDCLHHLNGMFAFALYDRRQRRLLLARDPLGIKPLYYQETAKGLFFASEIKALLAYHDTKGRPHLPGVADYLVFQYTLDDKTMFEGIRKLPPGSWLEMSPAGIRRGRYFKIDLRPEPLGFDQALECFEEVFVDAVHIHLRSDVPLGSHLSGGLDTGLVAAQAVRELGRPLHTFTAGFKEGGVYDDTRFAALTARHLSTWHHVVFPEREQFFQELPRLIWFMDEPAAGEGLFPQYCVSQMAAGEVKVVLGGQGADELFGGYVRYYLHLWLTALGGRIRGESPPGCPGLSELEESLPQLRNYWPLWRQAMAGEAFPDEAGLLLRMIARSPSLQGVLSEAAMESLQGYSPYQAFREVYQRAAEAPDMLNRILHFESTQWLPALLQVEDRASMACSLESRVPFMDRRLVELAFRLPGGVKMRRGELKSLLRQVARDRLPPEIYLRRDKVGFPVPLGSWDVASYLDELGREIPPELEEIFQADYLRLLRQSQGPFNRAQWGWLCLIHWWKHFIG